MNLRIHEHKDFVRFFISLILISIFFLVLIINSASAAVISPSYLPVDNGLKYKNMDLYNLENLEIQDDKLVDYFLANKELFSDDNSKGFYLSETLNALWKSNSFSRASA